MTYSEIYAIVKEKFASNPKNQKRFRHMEEVVKMALKINDYYHFNLDPEKIKISGILHDYTKLYSFEEAKTILKENLPVKECKEWLKVPFIIHSVTASIVVQKDFGIYDSEIIEAIKYHTTGNPGMGLLAEVIYVADAIEETRTYDGVEILREAVFKDFTEGMLLVMKTTVEMVKKAGYPLSNRSILVYESFKEKK